MSMSYSFFGLQEYTDGQVIPILRNLKHLQLIANNYSSGFLLHLSSFMTAFPYLRLVLPVGIYACYIT